MTCGRVGAGTSSISAIKGGHRRNQGRFMPIYALKTRGGTIYANERGDRAIQLSSRSGVRVYPDRGKRIGPVFSSVEKASNIFEPCPFEANLVSGPDGRRRLNKRIYWPHQNRGFLL